MGKKKRKTDTVKPWCYFCDREFGDEGQLIQHQKAKHFQCPRCRKRFLHAPGMAVHMRQVHHEELAKVPNALPGRDSTSLDIIGMNKLPMNDEHVAKRMRLGPSATSVGGGVVPPMGMGPPPMGMIGAPPMGMPSFPPPPRGFPFMFPPTPQMMGMPPPLIPPPTSPSQEKKAQAPLESVKSHQKESETKSVKYELTQEEELNDPGLVYRFEMTSMEERRAALSKYAYNPADVKQEWAHIDQALAKVLTK